MNNQELIDAGVPPEMAATFTMFVDYLDSTQERRHVELLAATVIGGYLASIPPGNVLDAPTLAAMGLMVARRIVERNRAS